MIYDSTVTACCVREMSRQLSGARIVEVRQPRRLELCLLAETPSGERLVTLSAEAQFARAHISAERPERGGQRYPFGLFAEKHLRGALVRGVSQVGFDRIIRIDVDPRNPRLADPTRTIVVEIMGKHSNIMLLNNVDMVLEAAKHITADMSRARTVLPHVDYVGPPRRGRLNPLTASRDEWEAVLSDESAANTPVERALREALEGANALPITEALHSAAINPKTFLSGLTGQDGEGLIGHLMAHYRLVAAGEFQPVRWTDQQRRVVCYPVALAHAAHETEPIADLGPALAESLRERRGLEETESKRRGLLTAIRRGLKSCRKRRTKLETVQRDAEAVEALRRIGDCILAAIGSIPPRSARTEIPDVYNETGGAVTVDLDPDLSPQANAERYFRRYKSEQRTQARLPEQLAQAEGEDRELSELQARVESADGRELQGLSQEVCGHPLLSASFQGQGGRSDGESPFLSVVSADGFEIILGRSAEESDQMLRTAATSDDIWLHARDMHGGHVLVRTNRHPDRVPMNTLTEAAQYAAFLSKAKHSSMVPVDYTLRKYVRKARKGPAGLHIYDRCKTLMVEPRRPNMDRGDAGSSSARKR